MRLKNEMTKRSEEIRKRFMAEIRKIKLQSIAFWVFGVLSSILSGVSSSYLWINYSGHTISSNNQPLSQGIYIGFAQGAKNNIPTLLYSPWEKY